MTKTVYLAGAIHGLTDDECRVWRDQATAILSEHGFATLNPMRRDYRGVECEHAEEIVDGDLADIESSVAVLVNASRPSWGTAMEVVLAAQEGVPVVAFTPHQTISPWLYHFTDAVVPTMEQAIKLIVDRLGEE